MQISGKTKVCGIIGDPIEHTLSPVIHNAGFSHLKLDFVYVPFTVKAHDLKEAMNAFNGLGIHGLNVTMPHKTAVLDFLTETDPPARFLGAVNTILNHDGKSVGFNTDGVGAINALRAGGADLKGKKLLLLGAGGAARAIAFCAAQEVEKITILNRTADKAEKLAKDLQMRFGSRIKADSLLPSAISRELKDADLLVNATSMGMHPCAGRSPVDAKLLRSDLCVMDIVYDPVETKLVSDAKSAGANVLNGLEMLVNQAAVSFEIWTNQRAPITIMKEAALRKLDPKRCIL